MIIIKFQLKVKYRVANTYQICMIDSNTGNARLCMMTQAAAASELLSHAVCQCKDMCDALLSL